MAYAKTNWTNTTPINTTNLNNIENGIKANDAKIGDLSGLTTPTTSSLVGAINSVVESGSNSNGSWIKYADGTMIVNQSISYSNLSCNSPWGTLYTTGGLTIPNFPVSFIKLPTVTYSWIVNEYNCWISTHDGQKKTVNHACGVQLVRPTTGTISGTLDIIAIGRWKE